MILILEEGRVKTFQTHCHHNDTTADRMMIACQHGVSFHSVTECSCSSFIEKGCCRCGSFTERDNCLFSSENLNWDGDRQCGQCVLFQEFGVKYTSTAFAIHSLTRGSLAITQPALNPLTAPFYSKAGNNSNLVIVACVFMLLNYL